MAVLAKARFHHKGGYVTALTIFLLVSVGLYMITLEHFDLSMHSGPTVVRDTRVHQSREGSARRRKPSRENALLDSETPLDDDSEESYVSDGFLDGQVGNNDDSDEVGGGADDDSWSGNQPKNPAPRTTDLPYNQYDRRERYFLYSPSGGLSNQLREIAYGLEIARLLNRTLYVPMIGRHSSRWLRYEALSYDELFPADRILDFDLLCQMVHCIPLNISVVNFGSQLWKQLGSQRMRIVFLPYREFWTKTTLMSKLGNEQRSVVYLRGAEMYHEWFDRKTTLRIRKFVRFSTHLRRKAIAIVNRVFPDRLFNAMHIRLSDYTERWGKFHERSRAILEKAATERYGPEGKRMNRSWPIYLSSDEPNNGGFADLKKQFKVVTSADLPADLVSDFKDLFPASRIRNDMVGVLEQLICAQARIFSGTAWSTFSDSIDTIRGNRARLFPEIANANETMTQVDEAQQRQTQLRSNSGKG